MFWQEEIKKEYFTLPETTQDAVFSIRAKILPIDHAYLLAQALLAHLPWLAEVNAGIHDISVADGNGWEQNHESGFYYPAKRSKLIIRIPKAKLDEIQSLAEKTLNLGKYQIKVVKTLKPRLMSDMPVVFAKYIAVAAQLDEAAFLQKSYKQLQAIGIEPKKMMAGLERKIKTPSGIIHTRSLMVAELPKSESVTLQEQGIGKYRLLGCGLFVPQKGIESVEAV